ncbi:MAG: hypothetical protein V3S26_02715 [Acidimicrobiia bacterium]
MSLVLVACSSEVATTPTSLKSIDTATTVATTATTSSSNESTTTTEAIETTTTEAIETTTTDHVGEPDFGPRRGDILAVIGVAHDATLNLRALPGPNQDILDRIEPLYDGLFAQGEAGELPSGFWAKVDYEGTLGWVHMSFIAYLGATDDVTSVVVADLNGYPVTDTMEELGLLVAEVFVSIDPPSGIVMTVGPTVGDLGEVTFDIIGLGDDAVRGVRLHVFGDPVDGEFALRSVESTNLCGRGVTNNGLCV